MPRFVRWSTNGITYGSDYLKRPKKLEELVAQGPWKAEEESTSGSEEYGTPDEHGTPSFEEWVSLKNVHKLQLADDKIKQLEMEKRAQESLNKALKRKLKKAKSSANEPPKQKRQFGGEEYDCQGDEQTKGNENQNRSLTVKFKVGTAQTTQYADDQPEAWAVIHDEQPLNHISPEMDYEDLPLTEDNICNLDKIVESQAASVQQSTTEKDNDISATVQSQVSSTEQIETTEDKEMNTYSKKRKTMDPMSIEKNVKLNPRNAKKTKDPDWEYDTPKDNQVHKKIIIKNLKCDNSTWDSLGDDLKMHYKQWFEARPNKKEDEPYWTCPEGWHCLSKSDLKRIIEHSDTLSSSLQVYMRLLKERAEAAKLPVRFMNMEIMKDVIEHETMLELHKLNGGTAGDFKSGYELRMEENFYNPLWAFFGKHMVSLQETST